MPSDNEAPSGAKDEVSPVIPHAGDDEYSEEGEASDYDGPAAPGSRETDSAESSSSPEEPKSRTGDSSNDAPPLPDEPVPGHHSAGSTSQPETGGAVEGESAPPLPDEAPPGQTVDDGWDAMWDAGAQAWYFYNRFTGLSQWDNPRVPTASAIPGGASSSASTAPGATTTAPTATAPPTISQLTSVAGGYNPAIHGSWDPNAPYAQAYKQADGAGVEDEEGAAAAAATGYTAEFLEGGAALDPYAQAAAFNARTGKFQVSEQNPERYSDAAKSQRQMNAYFDVDRAANSHDGKSLKAERRGKQPTKKELAEWKQKRKARKEEKRRAWLRD
ncbi:hypothetical protein SLS53_004623 [Cytospora paraplurivora]|uniref:WW domain-containing protein n=1 Tax=Cytospora paraplurivora TaxID=2898453 RepID=A0AAN9U7Z5_9PEZI